MSDVLQRLEKEVLIGPGDLPTNAEKKGLNLTENAAWWLVNHPDAYQEILKAWIDAGCDFVVANHGSANRVRLKKFGLQDKTREINYQLIKLAREVIPNDRYLIFSLPRPTTLLEPIGDASSDELYESFAEQIVIAEDTGVNLIRLNIDSPEQMEQGIKVVRDHSQLPIAALLSLYPTPKGFRTMTGLDPPTAAKKWEELGGDIIGLICGSVSYEETTTVLKEMRAACDRYLYARPNAGVPELTNGKVVHPGTPEQMASEAPKWVEAGARLIGGCCGTTPEHIAKVVAAIR